MNTEYEIFMKGVCVLLFIAVVVDEFQRRLANKKRDAEMKKNSERWFESRRIGK